MFYLMNTNNGSYCPCKTIEIALHHLWDKDVRGFLLIKEGLKAEPIKSSDLDKIETQIKEWLNGHV